MVAKTDPILNQITKSANNIDLERIKPIFLKKLLAAAVVDLATFCPEIIGQICELDPYTKTIYKDTQLSLTINSKLEGTNTRQSCVVALVQNNPEIIKAMIAPVVNSLSPLPMLRGVKEKFWSSTLQPTPSPYKESSNQSNTITKSR